MITERPANLLEPQMDEYRKELAGIARSEEDVLSYALFPNQAMDFFKKREDPFADVPIQNVTVYTR